jgi:hypothetical protein
MVAGPLQITTLTHGDLESFERDLDKLVLKKARQLTKRIADIETGATAEVGLDAEGVSRFWPVIVMAAPFPMWPIIMRTIRQRLKTDELLQGRRIGPVSIISAEELAAIEGELIATTTSLVELISEWKSRAATGDHSVKNYLVERAAQRGEGHPAAEHHRSMFDLASREMIAQLFHRTPVGAESAENPA